MRKIFGLIWPILLLVLALPAQAQLFMPGKTNMDGLMIMGLREKAEKGDKESMYVLGSIYLAGQIVEQDLYQAGLWTWKSAKKGYPDAMLQYGIMVIEDIVDDTPEVAFEYIQKAVEKKKLWKGAHYLGYCYDVGYGTEPNIPKAIEYYTIAANQGNPVSNGNLGYIYYTGKGVEKNYSMAFNHFLKAANLGNESAYRAVGNCYLLGHGIKQNSAEGMKWYEKAAEANNVFAMCLCGMLYYQGESYLLKGATADINYPKAIRYLNMVINHLQSTPQVKGEAARMISACYRFGRGVEPNEEMADVYLEQAAAYGQTDLNEVIKWFKEYD